MDKTFPLKISTVPGREKEFTFFKILVEKNRKSWRHFESWQSSKFVCKYSAKPFTAMKINVSVKFLTLYVFLKQNTQIFFDNFILVFSKQEILKRVIEVTALLT